MHPKRKKRLLIVLAGLAVVAVASGLILNAFRSNLVFFHTPTEIAAGQVDAGQVIRVGGLVEAGSVEREPGGLRVRFVITDTARSVPVRYEGILPDLFREGHGTVVQGRIGTDGELTATEGQEASGGTFTREQREFLTQEWDRLAQETERATEELENARTRFAKLLRTLQTNDDYVSELLEIRQSHEALKIVRELAREIHEATDMPNNFINAISPPKPGA